MALQVDQELRRELLLKALEACSDPDEALEIAVRMERFILDGQASGADEDRAPQENGSPQLHQKKKSPTRPRWTPDDDSNLRRLWQEKVSVDAIAEQLQRTPASIYGRVRQLGISASERSKRKPSQKTENAKGAAPRTNIS